MKREKERVIVYIDGFNLYFGLRDKGWKKYYWLNLKKLALSLLNKNQELVQTKYFTAKIKKPNAKRKRQEAFLSALGTLTDFSIHWGRYQAHEAMCKNCGYQYIQSNEKRTDVNIATHMLVDAFQGNFDTAILVSADSDLTLPIVEIRRLFPKKYIKVAFPPARASHDLERVAPTCFRIYENKLRKSLFPDKITLASGYTIVRPGHWK
jgi:uncharacterized LabA/DUF88 family protein